MNVRELHQLLETMIHADPKTMQLEVRVGDQIESGPYLHTSVGGVFKGEDGEVIICGNDDDQWKDESVNLQDGQKLETLWAPPHIG